MISIHLIASQTSHLSVAAFEKLKIENVKVMQ